MKFLTKTRNIVVQLLTNVVFRDKQAFIEEKIWNHTPRGGVVKTPQQLAQDAINLVSNAQASGFNINITDIRAHDSYGLGKTESKITVSNSFERMRAVMACSDFEVLPEAPSVGLFNIAMHPCQTHVTVSFKNGPVQYLRPAGPRREIVIDTAAWPVMTEDEPGYNQLMLMVETEGNYELSFNKEGHRIYSYVTGNAPILGSKGKDVIIFRSRGLNVVHIEHTCTGVE
jgi:hypothetical protein